MYINGIIVLMIATTAAAQQGDGWRGVEYSIKWDEVNQEASDGPKHQILRNHVAKFRPTERHLLDELLLRRLEDLQGPRRDHTFRNTYVAQFRPDTENIYGGPGQITNRWKLYAGWGDGNYNGLHPVGNERDNWNQAGAHIILCPQGSKIYGEARQMLQQLKRIKPGTRYAYDQFAFGVPVGSKPLNRGKACCSKAVRHAGGVFFRCCSPVGKRCDPDNVSGNPDRDCCANTKCHRRKRVCVPKTQTLDELHHESKLTSSRHFAYAGTSPEISNAFLKSTAISSILDEWVSIYNADKSIQHFIDTNRNSKARYQGTKCGTYVDSRPQSGVGEMRRQKKQEILSACSSLRCSKMEKSLLMALLFQETYTFCKSDLANKGIGDGRSNYSPFNMNLSFLRMLGCDANCAKGLGVVCECDELRKQGYRNEYNECKRNGAWLFNLREATKWMLKAIRPGSPFGNVCGVINHHRGGSTAWKQCGDSCTKTSCKCEPEYMRNAIAEMTKDVFENRKYLTDETRLCIKTPHCRL